MPSTLQLQQESPCCRCKWRRAQLITGNGPDASFPRPLSLRVCACLFTNLSVWLFLPVCLGAGVCALLECVSGYGCVRVAWACCVVRVCTCYLSVCMSFECVRLAWMCVVLMCAHVVVCVCCLSVCVLLGCVRVACVRVCDLMVLLVYFTVIIIL